MLRIVYVCIAIIFFFKKKQFNLFQIYLNRDHGVLLTVYSKESEEDAMRK